MASFMETKHHKTQTKWDAHKHRGDTLNHTHSHSRSLRDVWSSDVISVKKVSVIHFSQGSPKFMHLGLEWDHKTLGWNVKIMCIIVTLSFKPTTGGLYCSLLFYSLLCCHHNRRVFSVCLKLNVWPTHVFPNKPDTWKYIKRILCAGGWMRPLGLHTQNIFCIRI